MKQQNVFGLTISQILFTHFLKKKFILAVLESSAEKFRSKHFVLGENFIMELENYIVLNHH